MNRKLFGILCLPSLLVSLFSFGLLTSNEYKESTAVASAPGTTYSVGIGDYYKDVTGTGDTLLTNLRSLNLTKRKSTVGYSGMGTSTSGMFKYTDYDPNYVSYDSNGQPYGTRVLSFYSGTSCTSWNREHVWPNSRGGGSGGSAGSPYPDADIYMPRPTISSENSNRGNSAYVTDMAHSSDGWDPVTAFGVDGCYKGKSIRGEAARIIFYCMTVNSKLVLNESVACNGNNMGKLTDLLEWHVDNPINERELNRNNGGQYLQGNRNAFVDHPEYVCQVWGNTNAETKAICSRDPYAKSKPTSIQLNYSQKTLIQGETFTLSVASVTPSDAGNGVTYSSNNQSVALVNDSGLVTAVSTGTATITATSTLDSNVKTTCAITVVEPSPVNLISISATIPNSTIKVGETSQITIANNPSNSYPFPQYSYLSSKTNVVTVNNSGQIEGVGEGTSTITVSATQGSITKTATLTVTVSGSMATGTLSLSSKNVPTSYGSTSFTAEGYTFKRTDCGIYDGNIQFKKSSGYLTNSTPINGIKSITINTKKNFSATLYTSNTEITSPSGSGVSLSSGTTSISGNASYFYIKNGGAASYASSIDIEYGGGTTKTLASLSCSGTLSKTTYNAGENFNPTGLTVLAKYSDNTTADVTASVNWTPSPLSIGTTSVTGSYTENGTTKSIAISGITVTAPLSKELVSIEIKNISNVIYKNIPIANQYSVIAHYSNNYSDEEVVPSSVVFKEGYTSNTIGETKLIASYTYNDVTKKCEFTSSVTNVGCSQGYVPGQQMTYNGTITSKVFDLGCLNNVSIGNEAWDATIGWRTMSVAYGYNDTKGQQFGTRNELASYIDLKSVNSFKNVSKVEVYTCTTESTTGKHYLSIKVGDVSFTNTAYNKQSVYINDTKTKYTFTGKANGNVDILWTLPEEQTVGIFVKQIIITYASDDTYDWTGSEQALATVNYIKNISSCYTSSNKAKLRQCIVEYNAMVTSAKTDAIWEQKFNDSGYLVTYLEKIKMIAGQYNYNVPSEEQIELILPNGLSLGTFKNNDDNKINGAGNIAITIISCICAGTVILVLCLKSNNKKRKLK